jgi:glycosyltransferase involved in cell wall biosynthesis
MNFTIVYDHFIAKGGAENVSLQLSRALGDCEVQTAFADKELFKEELSSHRLKDLGLTKPSTPSLILFFLFIFRLPKNSVFLSGLFAPLCLLRANENTKAIVYFHMFPVFINWTFSKLSNELGLVRAIGNKVFIGIYCWLLKMAAKRAQKVFCNSKITQQKFASIGIQAEVLYPPVSLQGFNNEGDKNYFLSTCRLEKEKRIELILQAFKELPELQLKVIGGGPLFAELQSDCIEHSNIKFSGWKEKNEIIGEYNNCKALIYIPENEAFGISVVEALAAGKPVIGVSEGGLKETISNRKLGELIDLPITKNKLIEVIKKISSKEADESLIAYRQSYIKKFDEDVFYQKIREVINGIHEAVS